MFNTRSFIYILGSRKRLTGIIVVSLIICAALALAWSAVTAAKSIDVPDVTACENARTLTVQSAIQQSESWQAMKAEWIQFRVQKNARYRLQVKNAEGLELALYNRCEAGTPAVALRNGQLEFTATLDGEYYLSVKQDEISLAGLSGYEVSLLPAAPHRPGFAPAQDVPQDVLRRATEFLEELRGSDLAPEWKDARINPEIRILYRPDIQGPAYYECTVEKPGDQGFVPAGYIQLAAGDYDYPIVNWDITGMSTSQELAELAPLGATLTEIYRLDPLSYASEYEELTKIGVTVVATDVVNLGDLPNRIEGLDAIPEEPFELVTQGIDSDGTETYEGPAELPLLEQNPWDSWQALKDGYGQEYAPLLKSLKQRASNQWELEKNLSEYGETLIKGDVRTVYGLAAHTLSAIEVSGAGADAQYLQQEKISDNSTLTGIILTVLDEPQDLKTLLPIDVTLEYTSGMTETLKYAIANHTALINTNKSVFLPVVVGSTGQGISTASAALPMAPTWGPWHYYWADANAGSILYNQIPAHSGVNTSGCWSGCGATAWAMEFAWVDQRAAENHPTWRYHWGLYRYLGGLGADAVAPNYQDTGVNNMTWEIRNYLGTHCSGSGGSTYFTDMIDASWYVRPRASTGWRMSTRYDPTGLCWFGACNDARELARNQIVNRHAPAIIGANNHYPMAYGYAWQSETSCFLWWCSTDYNRWFYVNQGWGGSGNGWVDWDDVAFAGIYYPY